MQLAVSSNNAADRVKTACAKVNKFLEQVLKENQDNVQSSQLDGVTCGVVFVNNSSNGVPVTRDITNSCRAHDSGHGNCPSGISIIPQGNTKFRNKSNTLKMMCNTQLIQRR
jgi:hypothetical protein